MNKIVQVDVLGVPKKSKQGEGFSMCPKTLSFTSGHISENHKTLI